MEEVRIMFLNNDIISLVKEINELKNQMYCLKLGIGLLYNPKGSVELLENLKTIDLNINGKCKYNKNINTSLIDLEFNKYKNIQSISEVSDSDFSLLEKDKKKQIKQKLIEDYKCISNRIEKAFDEELNKDKIDIVGRIASLHESENKIYTKMLNTNLPNIRYFRSIRRDGNCFYRSLLFLYFENLIISSSLNNENITCLKFYFISIFNSRLENIYDFRENFENINYSKHICLKIFYNIIYFLEHDKIINAFNLFTQSFENNLDFNQIIICWYRLIVYDVLNNLEGKQIIESLNINEFINNSELSNYKENILKLGNDCEMLIIYISSFILKTSFTTIIFSESISSIYYSNENFLLDHPFEIHQYLPEFKIYLLYSNHHYEIGYTEDFIKINHGLVFNQTNYKLEIESDISHSINLLLKCRKCFIQFDIKDIIIGNCDSESYICKFCFYSYYCKFVKDSIKKFEKKYENVILRENSCFPFYILSKNNNNLLLYPNCIFCMNKGCLKIEQFTDKFDLKDKINLINERPRLCCLSRSLNNKLFDENL